MVILVTGAAGYIGSICSEVLLARGHQVIAVDNLNSGHRAAVPPAATFCQADLGMPAQLEAVFSRHQIDAIMHFAGEIVVSKSTRVPSLFYMQNVAYGIHLLDAMIHHNVKKFIFSSTAAVYGEPETVPIPEDHRKAPINPYGKSKLRFEEILADYRAYTGLEFVALRYFNAAGASAERGEAHPEETHLIPKVLEAAVGKISELQVFGGDYPTPDGSCVRDYIHVLDLADAHVRALEEIGRVPGEAFNIGASRGYSNLEVMKTTEQVTGKRVPFRVVDRRPGDPAVLIASNEKLKKSLGWEARHSSLEEILKSAWDWRQKFPEGYPPNPVVSSS